MGEAGRTCLTGLTGPTGLIGPTGLTGLRSPTGLTGLTGLGSLRSPSCPTVGQLGLFSPLTTYASPFPPTLNGAMVREPSLGN